MRRACIICSTPAEHGNRCAVHAVATPANPTGGRTPRDRTLQARFRRNILKRDEYTCQRCGHHDATGRTLRACHIVPHIEGGGYGPANGVTRCLMCDRDTDPYAR